MLNLICRQELECKHKTMMTLQDHIDKNVSTIGKVQKCQELHQSFLPALDRAVVFANKPVPCPGRSNAYPHLQ